MTTCHGLYRGFLHTALVLATLVLPAMPVMAGAACSGKLADLQSYAGKYRADHDLLAAPEIAARLARLPQETQLHLKRNLDVSGPVQLVDCHLQLAGNLPHQGGIEGAMFDVDLATGTVIAAIHSGGRIDIYLISDPTAGAAGATWAALPKTMREWAVKADSGFSDQHPRNLAQPASVRFHVPPAGAAPVDASAQTKLKIDFGKDAVKPTPAQDAAIRRATGDTRPLPGHEGEPLYFLALADVNGDGRDDLILQYTYASGSCGSAGCAGSIVMATANGYAADAITLPNFYDEIDILHGKHHGMHDLRYGGDSPPWYWNGKEYDINKNPSVAHPSGSSGSASPAWQIRSGGDRTVATAAAIDSSIKSLAVFCEQGYPLLAMVTKAPRPAGQVILTFVFRGWTVNIPMQQNSHNSLLWLSNVSRSDLPLWLAHRGNSPTTQSLASAADVAYLRINGQMEGQISLDNSTAATQAALASCYRY